MKVRGSGILAHVSSLPSEYGIGDFGEGAYRFIDFLRETDQCYWQVLPLTPIDPICGNSPYSSSSAFAGNVLFISPDLLVRDGYLSRKDLGSVPDFNTGFCEYPKVIQYKKELLEKASRVFARKKKKDPAFDMFCRDEADWLEEYVLFTVIKNNICEKLWTQWPEELKYRDPSALKKLYEDYAAEITHERFLQFIFWSQWHELKLYANAKGVHVIGDIPIYVRYDSADVWAHSEIFKLDDNKEQTVVAGVPPDYFSETGQLWGNPVYDWKRLQARGYDWWISRFRQNLRLYDILRIDHFRGFVACWEVPSGETTAINGTWVKAPVRDFFNTMYKQFTQFPVIAEDLGMITADVREEIAYFNMPGMRVLLFAFYDDDPRHVYLPHMYPEHVVVYPGTHDNNTVKGWFVNETSEEVKNRLRRYAGRPVSEDDVHWEMIRLAMLSPARTVLISMQDVLGLGKESRMNRPSVAEGNWAWRFSMDEVKAGIRSRLRELTYTYGRA